MKNHNRIGNNNNNVFKVKINAFVMFKSCMRILATASTVAEHNMKRKMLQKKNISLETTVSEST